MANGKCDENNMPEWAKRMEKWGNGKEKKQDKKPIYERKSEFVGGVIGNIICLYILLHLAGWFPSFLTDAWTAVLPVAIIASLVEIAGNAILIIYSPKILYHLLKVVMNGATIVSMIVTVTLWPFNIPGNLSSLLRIVLGLIIVIVAITTIVEFFKVFMPESEEE